MFALKRPLVRRHIHFRKYLVLITLIILIAVTYSHIFRLTIKEIRNEKTLKEEPLPELKNNLEMSDETMELSKSRIDQTKLDISGMDNLDQSDLVFDTYNASQRFQQAVEFDSMKQFMGYKLSFNNKVIGQITIGKSDKSEVPFDPSYERENATFFSLVRNEDIQGIADSIQSVESRFNSKYHYDWVFANDKPFNLTFKKVIGNLVSGNAYFVNIPKEYWSYPEWIDIAMASHTQERMKNNNVKYGGSESYRHMCRFNSGFFYRLPIMQKYKYYWRVEPNVAFQCDIFHQDWFKYMRENSKKYAFTLAPLELHTTVENLWETVEEFSKKWPDLVARDNNMAFLTEDGGQTYNMCHFWSNFEIGDMDFYRSKSYSDFFEYIDKAGGFYYSRWGDAPIHSMAVSLLLSKDELFYLDNSGYYHSPNGDCPWDPKIRKERRCTCSTKNDATWLKSSCIPKWYEIHGIEKPEFAPHYDFVNQHNPDTNESDKNDNT